jgi:arylsulfatase A-like enzyme
MTGPHLADAVVPAILVALVVAATLLVKSTLGFSQSGPGMRDEIARRFRYYVPFAMARLGFWMFAIGLFFTLPGAYLAVLSATAFGVEYELLFGFIGGGLSFAVATAYIACRALLFNPGLIVASWQYRSIHLHRLWRRLSPRGVRRAGRLGAAAIGLLCCALAIVLVREGAPDLAVAAASMIVGYAGVLVLALWEPDAAAPARRRAGAPNLILIGSDTLRADRIGAQRNGASLTPSIDRLAQRGTRFDACYVPCARTAPSMISLLTGTWPHTHGIRDNFVSLSETALDVPTLPEILGSLGYRTAAVSDWCGADLGKFALGFDILELPEDQWNVKYLLRQGPKDIRLFLTLFLHNRIGRWLLPELYYLGGVPQSTQLGHRGRRMISRLAAGGKPFLLNLFYSTTHPPFASEYPYYVRYANPTYEGESKFAMARLTEPFEIIRRQGEPRDEFDLDQILDLYDGCVAQFDEEVGRLIRHLELTGIADNTIVVLYSDHGMEFFEHGTWGQGNSALGDFSARVPLIVADPRLPVGQRVSQVIRTIDLFPTLLDLLRVPSVKCDGVSAAPAMLDPHVDLKLRAFNETGIWITSIPGLPPQHLIYPDLLQLLDVPDDASGTLAIKAEYHEIVLRAKDRMVRDGRWKLVYQPLESGSRLSLYDVEADPGCTRDLVNEHPSVVARLREELREWMEEDPVIRRHWRAEAGPDDGRAKVLASGTPG